MGAGGGGAADGLGKVQNILGREKFGGLALKKFLHPASTYKSTICSNFGMG